MSRAFYKTVFTSQAYLVLAFACLISWRSPHPLSRIDWFSGGYFLLRLGGSLHSIISSLGAFRSKAVRQEWWGLDSARAPRWVMLLMALDLTVFLDYGHWQLVPPLASPILQTVGLALYIAVTGWQVWTDEYLASYFNRTRSFPAPMNIGPYRYVRHPRYGAAIIGKIALALTFGSIFGWILLIPWAALLLTKIEVEEKRLRSYFGTSYESYSQQTAKVLPGIY